MKNFRTSPIFENNIYSFFQAKKNGLVFWSPQAGKDGELDYSGYDNHGTPNDLLFDTDAIGREKSAFKFNGLNDIKFGSSDLFSFTDGTSDKPFSLFCRIKDPNSPNTVHAPIAKATSATGGEYYIMLSSGSVVFRLIDEVNAASVGRRTRNNLIEPDRWYDVLVTYDGSGTPEGIKIIVGGYRCDESDSNVNTGYVSMQNTPKELMFGARGTSQEYEGLICDVRLFNAELLQKDAIDLKESIW